jgi:hypothetical protein
MTGHFPSPLGAPPVDRSATRPIYLLVAKDDTVKGKLQYYKVLDLTRGQAAIDIRGYLLEKAQADQVEKNPYAKESVGKAVSRAIPWHNVVRIDTLKYTMSKAQGE